MPVDSADAAPIHEGVLVGKRFRLERLLGRGAVGSVWLATHVALSAPVAIKFLDRANVIDPDEMEVRLDRFRFEAQISARLAARTSHTVAVQDAGVHKGIAYLVMEYAPGRTLDDLVTDGGARDAREIAGIIPQVAEALDVAHALGIIHRDVKLANILFVEREDSRSMYKLADFGVARMTGEKAIDLLGPRKTAEGLIVGTPAYMSPEQIGGIEDYGPSVDLWALGVVAYEMLTGKLPFNSSSLTELAMEISGRTQKPPSEMLPELGTRFDAFFTKALAKAPEERFTSASELAHAFARCLEDSGEQPVAHETPVEKKRRASWVPVVGVGVAIGVVAVVALAFSTPSKGEVARPGAPLAPASSGVHGDHGGARHTANERGDRGGRRTGHVEAPCGPHSHDDACSARDSVRDAPRRAPAAHRDGRAQGAFRPKLRAIIGAAYDALRRVSSFGATSSASSRNVALSPRCRRRRDARVRW